MATKLPFDTTDDMFWFFISTMIDDTIIETANWVSINDVNSATLKARFKTVPLHEVFLRAFYIEEREVVLAQYSNADDESQLVALVEDGNILYEFED